MVYPKESISRSAVSDSFVIPWTIGHQLPLSTGFFRQENWIGQPFPSSGDLPNPGIKPSSPSLQADSLPSEPSVYIYIYIHIYKTNPQITSYSMVKTHSSPLYAIPSDRNRCPNIHRNKGSESHS